jgi:hypothetical protein
MRIMTTPSENSIRRAAGNGSRVSSRSSGTSISPASLVFPCPQRLRSLAVRRLDAYVSPHPNATKTTPRTQRTSAYLPPIATATVYAAAAAPAIRYGNGRLRINRLSTYIHSRAAWARLAVLRLLCTPLAGEFKLAPGVSEKCHMRLNMIGLRIRLPGAWRGELPAANLAVEDECRQDGHADAAGDFHPEARGQDDAGAKAGREPRQDVARSSHRPSVDPTCRVLDGLAFRRGRKYGRANYQSGAARCERRPRGPESLRLTEREPRYRSHRRRSTSRSRLPEPPITGGPIDEHHSNGSRPHVEAERRIRATRGGVRPSTQ